MTVCADKLALRDLRQKSFPMVVPPHEVAHGPFLLSPRQMIELHRCRMEKAPTVRAWVRALEVTQPSHQCLPTLTPAGRTEVLGASVITRVVPPSAVLAPRLIAASHRHPSVERRRFLHDPAAAAASYGGVLIALRHAPHVRTSVRRASTVSCWSGTDEDRGASRGVRTPAGQQAPGWTQFARPPCSSQPSSPHRDRDRNVTVPDQELCRAEAPGLVRGVSVAKKSRPYNAARRDTDPPTRLFPLIAIVRGPT